jgi:hypothetical protein
MSCSSHWLALSLTLVGCRASAGLVADAGPSEPSSAATAKPHACSAPINSPLDVASEPPFRIQAAYEKWTDKQGCLVRIDVLFERPGPARCNFQETRVIGVGTPFGARYASAADSQQYVRDPNGVYKNPALVAGFNPMADLPGSAQDSGFRRGDWELWLDPQEPSGIYLKRGRLIERWPRGEVPGCE